MSEAALHGLAREAGILIDWEDADGQARTVGPDTLRAVLDALELPAENARQIAGSRRRLARQKAAPGFITADAGRPFSLDGRRRVIDEPGYHQLETKGGEVTVAVAPARCFGIEDAAPGRCVWAAAVQLYSLRGSQPAPYGDFGALAQFAADLAARGADGVAISPTHALFAADPERYGPYGPSTRLFLNPAYADPAVLFPNAEPLPDPGGELIDWPAATPKAYARLRKLHAHLPAGPLRDDFDAFRRQGGEDLEGHARFEALHGRLRTGWQDWPEPYRDSRGPAVEQFARENAAEVEFHAFAQWVADRSLAAAQRAATGAGMAIGLITDVAVGMEAGGSHAWSRPHDLLTGLSVGAPPDAFQAKGQDWGLTAFSPRALAASGFEGFIATLRAAMRHAGGVRIDHAMGLRRLWLIPRGAGPTEGAYLTYPQDDLLRLVALESHRARAVVVGEDLGTVPRGFRPDLEARGVLGMRVLPFERTGDGGYIPPNDWSSQAAALTTTHDLPTLAGWWRGRDIDWAVKLNPREAEAKRRARRRKDRARLWKACLAAGCATGKAPPPAEPAPAVTAAVAFVGEAASRLAIIPVEDLLGLEEQPNLPGVTEGHPNWRRRLPATAAFDHADVEARLRALNASRPR